ncbi:hypothetical protein [Sphingobium subterraneum]|uniref:Phospholipase D-like domain-containing protein n=1 Tax=Sphingobium subterraneum TaxID=627688 RepID=A0A841J7L2_9SPHN|nr:hypothetical protein [Sphingobium subterraneum]MBB6124548.1 hypothetical protein [Sphingobium subterraneum]
MDEQTGYALLGQLVAEMPTTLSNRNAPFDVEEHRWLGRAIVRSEPFLDTVEFAMLKVAAQGMDGILRSSNARKISILLNTALARAEEKIGTPSRGSFLPAASPFDALMQIDKIVSDANLSVLFVDPYSDEKLLNEFARTIREGVSIRILSARQKVKATLKVAVDRWVEQFGQARPLEVRLTEPSAIHDRLIAVDDQGVWIVGQFFNGLAAKAPTTIMRLEHEPAQLKLEAMRALWEIGHDLLAS